MVGSPEIPTSLLLHRKSILVFVVLLLLAFCWSDATAQALKCADQTADADIEKSLAELTAAIKAEPNRADLYVSRGRKLRTLNRNPEAMKDSERAIELDPTSDRAYRLSGGLYADRASWGWAVVQYTKAIKLNPKNVVALYERGRARVFRGESAASIKDFTQVLAILPEDMFSLHARGTEFEKRGEFKKAEQDFSAGLEIISKRIESTTVKKCLSREFRLRGLIYWTQGKKEQALTDFTTAIEIEPTFHEYYNSRGRLYFLIGQFEPALSDLTHAIKLYPDFALSYIYRAAVYDALSKKEQADADRAMFEKLSNSSPSPTTTKN